VVYVNSLVPVRFGKVVLTYVPSGYGAGKVQTAKYYSNGVYQETRIVTRGNALGSAHKTTINFVNRTPASLAGKAFVVYDDLGAVKVWFNVDGASTEPGVAGTYRSIQVSLLTGDNHEVVAQKTSTTMGLDASFLSIYTMYYIIISSSSAGIKLDSYDFSTQLYIKNTSGTKPKTLNNTYWLINSAANASQYYVWYNVNGGGTDPALAGKTGLMVAISTTSTAAQVASLTKIVLDATTKFITNISDDTMRVSNVIIGATTSLQENTADFVVFNTVYGEDRVLLADLVMEYDVSNFLIAVERL
jgi:hypothetical protein